MAASGYTPISIYHSTTASAVPVNTNLVNGELAINIADGKLYYKDSGGTVQVIATKGAGTIGGSDTQVQYNSSGALAGSANFTFNGTTATINTLNLTNALGAAYGGTAQSTYTQGDLLYASAANTLSKLAIGSNNQVLTSSGTDPVWVSGLNITTLTATQDVTFSATSQNIALGTSQTSGLFTIGGASQTGAIVIGQSTKTQSLSIANGAVESGLTKTINIGTNGDSGSTTNINIGSGSGAITTNFSGTVNAVTTNIVGSLTASNAVTFSATTQNIALGTSQSSGTWTAGGASQTGALTLDQSTKTHTLNLGTGATESGETKTINLGTGGVSTSTTAINIGSANGTTLTINSSAVSTPNGLNFDSNTFVIDATNNRVGINNASPTVALDVTGALTISGNAILGDATTDTVTVNGYMSTGGAVNASFAMYPRNTALTGTTQAGVYSAITGASDATSAIYGVVGDVRTAAAAFTVTNVSQVFAADATKGAGSTITNQHGIRIADQTQGTNNFGITSLVSSGTNKWNIYASGTAANYFAGQVGIGGTTLTSTAHLTISGSGTGSVTGGGILSLFRPNTTVVAGSNFGSIYFTGADTTSNTPTTLAYIRGQASGTHDPGDNPTDLVFAVTADGTDTVYEAMRLNQAGGIVTQPIAGGHTVFNENGVDADFRVESDTNTHALFVQGSDGFVGIGTSTPGSLLELYGPSNAVIRLTDNDGSVEAGSVAGKIEFNNLDTTSGGVNAYVAGINESSVEGSIALTFATGTANTATERLRIDSTGNLGLGVTPSTSWWASMKSIGVGRLGNGVFGATNDDEINIGANVINTGSGTYIYGATDTASLYRQVAAQHVWYYAGSGTAGAALTLTEAMRINASGNVSIGGTANRATTVGSAALNIFNGTAPVGTLTNGISIYSSAGEAYVMDAAGNATLFSPHDSETNEWIFKSKHTPTGKVLKIDVEKLLRFVNNHFGLDAIQEFIEE